MGAFQVTKQKRPEGIQPFAFIGVFLMTEIVIAADGIFDTRKILSDSSYLLEIFENLDLRWLYSTSLIEVFLFILGSPVRLPQYTAVTISMATLFAGFSSQQKHLDISSEPIGPDFAGQYLRDEFPDIPGNAIYPVGSDKQLVEASIFWMDRPGLEFGLYQILKYPMAGLLFIKL